MTEGPLGGPRPFAREEKTITVLIGVDGREPPNNLQLSAQEVVNTAINQALIDAGADIEVTRQTVNLTVRGNPTQEQINELGPRTQHVQQYDVKTELKEVDQGLINAVHNTVLDEVEDLGFFITGAKTTVR